MDKRKLKFRGGLHKNLTSQISRNDIFQTKSLIEQISKPNSPVLTGNAFFTQSQNKLSDDDIFSKNTYEAKLINEKLSCKRKLSNCTIPSNSDDNLDFPLAESTVLKKRKDNCNTTSNECSHKSLSNVLTVTEKNVNEISTKKCKFVEFLYESGIEINSVPHILNKDIIIIRKKMKELLNCKKYEKMELISLMEKYFENEQNLKNALADMELLVNNEVPNVLCTPSLIKILLQVSELHPEIYSSLLSKLNEAVLMVDSIESVPWALLLLHQFRFLDVVINSDALINSLEQLLASCPLWFQNELIMFLPDIITDKQHQTVAEILNKILKENSALINLILNCMTNLNLEKEYLDEYKEETLNSLTTTVKINAIAAIVKFVLEDCANTEIFEKTLKVLRNTHIQPLVGEDIEECYQSQLDIVNTLKMNMLHSKNVVNKTITLIKDIIKDPKPLDIILLLLIFSTTKIKKKTIETIFKQHIRSGFYRTSLLNLLYNDYKKVLQELQPTALQISTNLLKANERVFIDFSIDWLCLQFKCHKEDVFKQREIVERIIFLMGDSEQTVKNTLTFLRKMVEKEEYRQYLTPHCNHLRILLEKMDNLNLKEVGTLNDVLQHLCTNTNSIGDSLRDDLFILLQKQLSYFNPLTKSKGVLGAVMAIKHLMQDAEESDAAYNLFKTVLNNVKSCPRSQALFYDQLICIISQTQCINTKFMKNLTDYIEEEFVNANMIDKTNYKGKLVPKFGLNKVEDEPQNCVLTFEDKKYGAIIPISFKLLKTCCIRLSQNENLDAIDSLLGCAILMPEDLEIAENSIIDIVICCINWFREVISGFVTQKDFLLQKQVMQRLDNLIDLQSELSRLFSLCDTKYQPPPCYFHQFPLPPFVGIDKKIGKKGKKGKKQLKEKSVSFNESQDWELGSLICSKNPIYFRKFDAMIVHLFDVQMEMDTSQSVGHSISIKQIRFIIQELLGMFEHNTNEKFIKDLIELLPKICAKLRDIIDSLREEDDSQNRAAVRLFLCLLTKIFSWKGFESVTYNILLREGLRILASQSDQNNIRLRSCKELVTESCRYFESLSDIVTQISLSISLINVCQSLMKHSASYTKQNKEKYEDNHSSMQYKSAVIELLNNWINNEILPLQTVTLILDWLPDEISKLEKPQSSLNKIPSITRSTFHFLYKKMFDGLINGIKIALPMADRDPKRIELWYEVAKNVQKLVQICKTLTSKNNVLIFLKHMPILLKSFLNLGMPILEHNLKYQAEDVTKILKMMQSGTRYLHTICCDSAEKKDLTLTKYIPAAKSILEKLIYCVTGMLVNQSSEESIAPNSNIIDDATNISSDILENDSSDDLNNEDDML
ncbi:Fanconi anemia group D2 protein [Eufriesea mexicana]|uniref:Fanconi anemia group D2 protein n=1 Tax=Eufriesea mexicana TaxID=516756 RepID=A0A310SGS9_9HYME|nr:Fanconi anemia group D2 protein [Eufriesea mexicana]